MRFGVFGLGRFGFFWAGLLTRLGPVAAYNRSARAVPEGVANVGLAELGTCDVVFLCNAISSMPEVCKELARHVKPDTIVADTCSVKVFPVSVMKEMLPGNCSIVASHPMFGPDSAKNGVDGLPMVMSPVRIEPDKYLSLKERFSGLGIKVMEMSPDEHDREAARTQGLTHIVGRLLAEMSIDASPIATLGYRKLNEIMEQTCNDPWQLFVDLQTLNPYSAGLRTELKLALERLFDKLDRRDGQD